ncbi:MAG: SDR family oxidoreductase [Muribaculaceae bacterium]|nr:SDR family oxidoreductase [Muribaculaceae bacterium]
MDSNDMLNFLDFREKTILITGAASGIGLETAKTLHKLNASLILLDVNEEALEILAADLNSERVVPIVCNLSEYDNLNETLKTLLKQTGPINGFVHCAGISSRKPLNVLRPDGFTNVMAVNFFSFEELTRLLTKRSVMQDGGSIVVMSSVSSFRGYKAKTEYCVSKAAVDAFVRCMALELASRKIRINSIQAAEVLTPLARKSREIALQMGSEIADAPLGPSEPYEVANLIAFLLSDATRTITGTGLVIDGGLTV